MGNRLHDWFNVEPIERVIELNIVIDIDDFGLGGGTINRSQVGFWRFAIMAINMILFPRPPLNANCYYISLNGIIVNINYHRDDYGYYCNCQANCIYNNFSFGNCYEADKYNYPQHYKAAQQKHQRGNCATYVSI